MTKSDDDARSWETYARELGHNLARARAALRLSQERVGHLVGISGHTYHRYEKGLSPGSPITMSVKTLVTLSDVLQVPVSDLLPTWTPQATDGA